MKLQTVKEIYRQLNTLNFGDVLEQPIIKFTRSRFNDGTYNRQTMQFNLADITGFDAVRETVYHEMIHQYIDEFLSLDTWVDHGKDFKQEYNKFAFGIIKDKKYELAR